MLSPSADGSKHKNKSGKHFLPETCNLLPKAFKEIMPNYDYKCESCKEVFEVFQRMSDPVVTVCPKCGKSTVERLITGGNFTFKGSGFYITDYKTPSSPKESPKETPIVTPKSDT